MRSAGGSSIESLEAWAPDFDWVTDHIAVGGCFPAERAAELAASHGIGAVVDLRQEDCDDVEVLGRAGLSFLHLPTPDMHPVPVAMLERGVRFAAEHIARGDKVLIHCQHGIGRSALLALCVMVDQGLEPMAAIRQAKDRRERVSPSPAQFEGWCAWLRGRGHEAPDMHSFGCIAYRHLAHG
ncbi:MAG TPA: dual specificity protein phosphatase family protein [Sphingomicrobium sp.]|nr:dual specificity protein phosphatase family protein [Sphingomicrobium sp.]